MSRPRRSKTVRHVPHPASPPAPLHRAPRTNMHAGIEELNDRAFAALEAVAGRLLEEIDRASSLPLIQLYQTESHLLLAMKSTHRSLCRLVSAEDRDLDLSVDALPLARVQLERCFLALLLADHPRRWLARYRKNAFKAFGEKFLRDQRTLGHLEPYREHYAPDGPGVQMLRRFAREMDVNEDELQTLRWQVLQENDDPRWKKWFIPDMPTPGKTVSELKDPALAKLSGLLYSYYDSLSHFSHGGLVGVMSAAILRPRRPGQPPADVDPRRFWSAGVMETSIPLSYVAMLVSAGLFAHPFLDDEQLRAMLRLAWQPYQCDGSPVGVAVWDAWASSLLANRQGDEGNGARKDAQAQ